MGGHHGSQRHLLVYRTRRLAGRQATTQKNVLECFSQFSQTTLSLSPTLHVQTESPRGFGRCSGNGGYCYGTSRCANPPSSTAAAASGTTSLSSSTSTATTTTYSASSVTTNTTATRTTTTTARLDEGQSVLTLVTPPEQIVFRLLCCSILGVLPDSACVRARVILALSGLGWYRNGRISCSKNSQCCHINRFLHYPDHPLIADIEDNDQSPTRKRTTSIIVISKKKKKTNLDKDSPRIFASSTDSVISHAFIDSWRRTRIRHDFEWVSCWVNHWQGGQHGHAFVVPWHHRCVGRITDQSRNLEWIPPSRRCR